MNQDNLFHLYTDPASSVVLQAKESSLVPMLTIISCIALNLSDCLPSLDEVNSQYQLEPDDLVVV